MLEGVALYLQDRGLLTFDPDGVGGDTYIDSMPDQPNAAVMLRGTGGLSEPSVRHPFDTVSFQVMVRGTRDPRPAKARAEAIYSALQGLHRTKIPDGTYVVGIGAIQPAPIPIGMDENNRHRYSLNFWARVRAITQHRPGW